MARPVAAHPRPLPGHRQRIGIPPFRCLRALPAGGSGGMGRRPGPGSGAPSGRKAARHVPPRGWASPGAGMSVMPDSRWLRRMLVFGLLGVAAMTVVVPGILLARGTTGHDWYSAGKLTLEEAILAMGFSKYTAVAYRREYGDTWNIMRAAFVDFGPPVRARRQRILATIGDGVMLGGGIGGTVFCLMLLGAAGHLRRGRTVASVEPVAYPVPASGGMEPGRAHRGLAPVRRRAGGESGWW